MTSAGNVAGVAVTRMLALQDAAILAELLRANRTFLAPWQPVRAEDYFSAEGQRKVVSRALVGYQLGNSVPRVIVDEPDRVVGMISLLSVVRGAFQSCTVAYWLAEDAQGRGLATRALSEVTQVAFHELRLHRVQATTGRHNARSQRVLERLDFTRYGAAEGYMKIAGSWQDSVLYQLLTPTSDLVASH